MGLPGFFFMAKKAAGRTFIQRSRSKTPAEKAAFHQIDGAGKSKVKRLFFELDNADEAAIVDRIQGGIDKALRG